MESDDEGIKRGGSGDTSMPADGGEGVGGGRLLDNFTLNNPERAASSGGREEKKNNIVYRDAAEVCLLRQKKWSSCSSEVC